MEVLKSVLFIKIKKLIKTIGSDFLSKKIKFWLKPEFGHFNLKWA
ncbi:hypothetical protein ADICYQ_0752 [Cyclobacterium qasimii M12-11B]|uniref:Uncharacterized protein n=1 Tax=Cyclobacterium qasimii M12-11B TaxID=641524 RepID=S7X4A8_9BACT|nr:hypothetical protein ADICYQ_0752 [Cyclobacterium qasimii M12-11B]